MIACRRERVMNGKILALWGPRHAASLHPAMAQQFSNK